jgi:hypothetical protein
MIRDVTRLFASIFSRICPFGPLVDYRDDQEDARWIQEGLTERDPSQ